MASAFKKMSAKDFLVALLVMAVVVAILHEVCLYFYPKKELDPYSLSDYWPMSVFDFRNPGRGIAALGLMLWVAFMACARRLLAKDVSTFALWSFGLVVVVCTNLLHGVQFGLDYPTAGWGDSAIEYYNDAVLLKSTAWFLNQFNYLQDVLEVHSKTHPPGAVLLYYWLKMLLSHPIAISVAVSGIALGLSLPAWRRLIDRELGAKAHSSWVLLLYISLPAVQIYFLAVLDAVIAGLMIVAMDRFLDRGRPWSALFAAAAVTAASFLSHGFLWILPVLAGFELLHEKSLRRLTIVVAFVIGFYTALYLLTDYNHWAAFSEATSSENKGGFLLFSDPRKYFWYRLGSVLEILIFLTPFLVLQFLGGFRQLRERAPRLATLCWLGLASLAAVLVSGAFQIGEAARICIFIIPCLLLPAVAAATADDVNDHDRMRLLAVVFSMALVMQLFGFYQW